jgi:EmrB/QacA subfamily drug resistance transporter
MRNGARLVTLGVMLSIVLAAMESTVVATAMPTVVRSLGGLDIYSWVFSSFLLTSTVTMPLWGRVSDLLGRRRPYLIGLVIFLVGSALSGLSGTMWQLVMFRAIQGLGAGCLLPIGMTIIADLYGLERRARMQGYFSGMWGGASLAGPLIGGLLADHVSWRWAFYINVPFGLAAIALIAAGLRGDALSARRPRVDLVGLMLFTAGVSALLVGLIRGGQSAAWNDLAVVGPLALAAGLLGAFLVVERRVTEPIIPLGLFRMAIVRAATANGFLSGMAMFGAIAFVPLFMQDVTGASATAAGFVLTPFVLGWVLCSIVSARVLLRIGYRKLVITGMLCLATAFVLFSTWDAGLSRPAAMGAVLIAGVGMGLTFVPLLIAVQSAVRLTERGAVTSLTQFFRTIGGTVGVTVMGAVMAHRLQTGSDTQTALHGVFVVGLVVSLGALLSAFLVPAGSAQELAQASGSQVASPGAPH